MSPNFTQCPHLDPNQSDLDIFFFPFSLSTLLTQSTNPISPRSSPHSMILKLQKRPC